MTWLPPNDLELAHGHDATTVIALQAVAIAAKHALVSPRAGRFHPNPDAGHVIELLCAQLEALDAAIDLYRQLVRTQALLQDEDLF